jgi:hypothetical protein
MGTKELGVARNVVSFVMVTTWEPDSRNVVIVVMDTTCIGTKELGVACDSRNVVIVVRDTTW